MVPRREALRTLAVSVAAGFAGCNTIVDGDGTRTRERIPTVTPTTTLTPTRTPEGGTATSAERPTEPPTATGTPTPTATPSPTPTPTIAEAVGTPALTHGAGGTVDEFGRAVALSDGTAIVVAEDRGVYVFEDGDGWTATAVLMPDGIDGFGGFHVSAALVGDIALAGGPDAGPEPGTGAIYLFERADDGWAQRHRFGSGEDRDEFGRSVAFDGDRLVVGDAHDPGPMVPWTGGAYVFGGDGTGWHREATIGTDAGDLFGTSVAVDGDVILAGAPYADPEQERTGVVYAYGRANGDWQRQGMLSPEDPDGESRFGQSVALDGGTALVGAPGTREGGGSAYVFERRGNGWTQQDRVTAPGVDPGAGFGQSVAFVGGVAAVGAPRAHGTGRAYVFRTGDGRVGPRRLTPADPPDDAEFGGAVALSETATLVGSPGADVAYLFDL